MSALRRHNVRLFGQGPRTLIFAHGYGCDQNVWRHVAPAFVEDFRVVLFDFAGAGGSDPGSYDKQRHGTLEGHAADLLEVCEEANLEQAIFVGHSVGAMIGVMAARQAPERFSHLVLVGPNPSYIDDGEYRGGFSRDDIDGLLDTLDSNFFSWARMMAPVIMGNAERPELGEELANNFCSIDPAIARHFARVTFLSDTRAELPLVRTPALIMQCSDDALASVEVGEYVQRSMPGSELAMMQAKGHCPHLSAPAETVATLQRYLARHGEVRGS